MTPTAAQHSMRVLFALRVLWARFLTRACCLFLSVRFARRSGLLHQGHQMLRLSHADTWSAGGQGAQQRWPVTTRSVHFTHCRALCASCVSCFASSLAASFAAVLRAPLPPPLSALAASFLASQVSSMPPTICSRSSRSDQIQASIKRASWKRRSDCAKQPSSKPRDKDGRCPELSGVPLVHF